MRLYDITPPVRPGLPVWPGDTPYQVSRSWAISRGDSVNVSAITSTPHLGAHADAPFHVDEAGATIDELPLEAFLGPCRLVEVPSEPLILPRHLPAGIDLGDPPRLLLRAGREAPGSSRTEEAGEGFPEHFPALSPELARALVDAGARLVGLDSPSVDPFDSTELAAHHVLAAGGVVNLEGLALEGVPPGVYELVALPLRLEGLDASPVRAVLRELPG
jgi:arylformamidase